jgi:hypothetical protein
MTKSEVIRKVYLILTMTFVCGFFNLYGQENGYWKLERIETQNKEESFGQVTRLVKGEAGDLTYSEVNGNNNSQLIVKGNWSPLPEILKPKNIVSVSANLKINEFTPPSHHWSPTISMNFTSYYSSGTFEERKMSTGYCNDRLTVKASNSDDPNKNIPAINKTVSVKVPESPKKLKGDVFIVNVKMGTTNTRREYFYIFRWQTGQPSAIISEPIQGSAWKLERIETQNKEESFGKVTRLVKGEAGDLTYSEVNGNNNSQLIVKGNWSPLPEILKPKNIVSVSANLKIDQFTPPSHHWSPTISMNFTSYYSSGTFEERKMSTGYCNDRLTVKASTSDDPNKNIPTINKTVTIKVPESPDKLKGDVFIINVKMGTTNTRRDYFYIYKWQSAN